MVLPIIAPSLNGPSLVNGSSFFGKEKHFHLFVSYLCYNIYASITKQDTAKLSGKGQNTTICLFFVPEKYTVFMAYIVHGP